MLYCSIIKADFAAFAAWTRFSRRTSIWDELTDEKFNNNFVILYMKPMLQITGHNIQTTYLSMITNPTMFSPDHITRIKFLLFIFTWFIWFITLALIIIIIIMELGILAIVRVCVFNIREIRVFNFFWRNDVCFIDLFRCFAIIAKSINWTRWASLICKDDLVTINQSTENAKSWGHLFCNIPLSLIISSETIQLFPLWKKSEFLVDCLDSFWMTASMSSILQNACYDPSKLIIDNWPNTIRTAFTLMGFKIFEWFFQLVIFCCTQRFCNNISWLELSPTPITVAKSSGLMVSFHERFQTSCVLSDCNWTQTQNHLVRKRTLNHLAKLEHTILCSNHWICWWECPLSSDRNVMHP